MPLCLQVLGQKDIVGVSFPSPFVIERPKVMKNPHTQQYVMYIHLDDAIYTSPHVGVATSSSPVGPFKFVHAYKPDGYVKSKKKSFIYFTTNIRSKFLIY